MNIILVCQARTGSSRLPGKVLLPVAGKPLLLRFLERVRRAKLPTHVVVATTTDPEDNVIVDLCTSVNVNVFRGHPTDLLDRHVKVARTYGAHVVVKVPSDCPLIDPAIIDKVILAHLVASGVDFTSNLHPPSWPDGNDVEVMDVAALERAWYEARKDFEREHTTPWLWNANANIRCQNIEREDGRRLATTHRWTIDYPEDYMFVRAVYECLMAKNPYFNCDDILELIEERPEIAAMNAHLAGRSWQEGVQSELKVVYK